MRISEMEVHHSEYIALEERIRDMLESRAIPAVFSVCEATFPSFLPAIKYRKKRAIQPETPDWLAFGTICKYAPPLFEHRVLESLRTFVASTRPVAQHENRYLLRAEEALKCEDLAHRMWNHIARSSDSGQRDIATALRATDDAVAAIVCVWEELGIIPQEQERCNRLLLATQLHAETDGLCPACGIRVRGRREAFFRVVTCKKCGAEGYYHIMYSDRQRLPV